MARPRVTTRHNRASVLVQRPAIGFAGVGRGPRAPSEFLGVSGRESVHKTSTSVCYPASPASPVSKVVDKRQANFLFGMTCISGTMGEAFNHHSGIEAVRDAADAGCAVALAAICLDDEDQRVRQHSFDLLNGVPLSGKKYKDGMVLVCKVLCARACAHQLVSAPPGYDYVQEFKEAADLGCPIAACCYGLELEKQDNMPGAMRWYHKADAEGGYATARFVLGQHYIKGIGVDQDSRKALKYMLAAANQGSSRGIYAAAVILFRHPDANDNTQLRNDAKAFQMLSKAANAYDIVSSTPAKVMCCNYLRPPKSANPHGMLSWCYYEGRGVAQNYRMAAYHASKHTVCV